MDLNSLVNIEEKLEHIDLNIVKSNVEKLQSLTQSSTISQDLLFEELSKLVDSKSFIDPEYSVLAGRVEITRLRQNIAPTFSEATIALRPVLLDDYIRFVVKYSKILNSMVVPERDMKFTYFAVKTLAKTHLCPIRKEGKSVIHETPQYMYLRIATFLWYDEYNPTCLESIRKSYEFLSKGMITHATPTMINAATRRHQLSSCFTTVVNDDMTSITKNWARQGIISMLCGGLGIDMSRLRHSEIGQSGFSAGLVPWIKVTEQILNTVDQGGRRRGAGAVYCTDYHMDVFDFVDMKLPDGAEDRRARSLFYGLWVSDLFMRRVEADGSWTLFCPKTVPALEDKWGVDFEIAYEEYERKIPVSRTCVKIKARDLWERVIISQIKSSGPYILYKDACNRKSNQQNIGPVTLSNLCTEILLAAKENEPGSCNLGSVSLKECVTSQTSGTPRDQKSDGNSTPTFDFGKLDTLTRWMVRSLDQVIDRNYYPPEIPEIGETNLKNRPLGIGVQGLADTYALMDLCWDSVEAIELNKAIFETMYYAAVSESIKLADEKGCYPRFKGSPASKGKFQFDLWSLERLERKLRSSPQVDLETIKKSNTYIPMCRYTTGGVFTPTPQQRYDWNSLRPSMTSVGMRHSLLVALMPTAASAHIIGSNESFEPFTALAYSRTVLSGQFFILNKYLVDDLRAIGCWNFRTSLDILNAFGSIQSLKVTIPDSDPEKSKKLERLEYLKKKYRTAFELGVKLLIQMSADRGEFVCQSQSFNIFTSNPSFKLLNNAHFTSWRSGLKTGMYYLVQNTVNNSINYSLKSMMDQIQQVDTTKKCETNGDGCTSCSV